MGEANQAPPSKNTNVCWSKSRGKHVVLPEATVVFDEVRGLTGRWRRSAGYSHESKRVRGIGAFWQKETCMPKVKTRENGSQLRDVGGFRAYRTL